MVVPLQAGLLENLVSSDFVSLVRLIERFVTRSAQITGFHCPTLRSSLLTQVSPTSVVWPYWSNLIGWRTSDLCFCLFCVFFPLFSCQAREFLEHFHETRRGKLRFVEIITSFQKKGGLVDFVPINVQFAPWWREMEASWCACRNPVPSECLWSRYNTQLLLLCVFTEGRFWS